MPQAFLLRFQEPCQEEAPIDRTKGVKTATKIDREGTRDQASDGIHALPARQIATTTRQEREGTDKSDNGYGLPGIAVPVSARATKTVTFVRDESSDDDTEDAYTSKAIPRLDRIRQSSTKTVTAVKAETNDEDDDRQTAIHVIRTCS